MCILCGVYDNRASTDTSPTYVALRAFRGKQPYSAISTHILISAPSRRPARRNVKLITVTFLKRVTLSTASLIWSAQKTSRLADIYKISNLLAANCKDDSSLMSLLLKLTVTAFVNVHYYRRRRSYREWSSSLLSALRAQCAALFHRDYSTLTLLAER